MLPLYIEPCFILLTESEYICLRRHHAACIIDVGAPPSMSSVSEDQGHTFSEKQFKVQNYMSVHTCYFYIGYRAYLNY